MTASAIDFIAQQQPTLTQLFEAQVLKTPDDIALLFEDADGTQQQLTYRELNQQANQLAQQIRARYQQEHQQPMAADTLIALYLDRSLAMVISILAVLKAGAAYVPVSPNYPQQRSQYIFNDAGAAIILTQTKHLTMVADGLAGEPIVLAVDSPQLNYQKDGFKDNLACYSSANDLAYVIYTSGTTGQPKGVMLAHRGAVNMVQSLAQIYGVDDCQRALLFSEYVFDASVFELFVALTQGLSLYLANDNQRKNVLVLQQLITAQKIELLPLTPAVLSLISNDTLSSVKVVVIGGETPPQVLLERVAQHTRLFNAYGPTETSVCVSCHRFHHGDDAANIGTAINNTQLVILNDQLVPVADGEAGELYIGGAGLARGYLHQPQLTAARFIPNPLATEQDIQQGFSRLYKSGDMVRRLPTGDLQFLGRNDDQLKIRGFRVELAEIESVLSGLDGVNQVVVLALEHAGQPMLVAYLVLDKTLEKADNSSITPASLKAAAQEILAEYMVPASFNVIDKMPLTINGKVDKNGLAPPVWLDEAGYVAPCNALEQQLCVILQQLLGLEQVGIDDDFFQLGINSLLASALIIKLNEADTNSLQAADIFANSTVAKLAEKINQTVSQAPDNQQPLAFFSGPRPDFIPLSYQNQQIWFLQQFDHHIRAYNCQFKLCLKGPLAIDRLQQTLDIIIERHEIYRTVFVEVDGQPGQLVLPPWQAAIKQFDLSDRDSAQQKGFIADFIDQQGNDCFDIGQLPLLRWTLFKKSQYEYELVQFEHHFVHDGVSFNLLLTDLKAIYSALVQGQDKRQILADLPVACQYADYTLTQQHCQQSPDYKQKLHDWSAKLAQYPVTSMFAGDYPRPKQQTFVGERIDIRWDDVFVSQLESFSQQQGVTLYATMLSAFALLVNIYSRQDQLLIASGASNRHSEQEQSVIGMLVNSAVIPLDIGRQVSIGQWVQASHQSVLDGLKHQDIAFAHLVDAINPERRSDMNPLCQLCFSFHDSNNPTLDFAGLNGQIEILKNHSAKFDINLVVIPPNRAGFGLSDDNRLQLLWEYDCAIFSAQTINTLIGQYREVLQQMLVPGQIVSQINLLDADQRQQLFDGNRVNRHRLSVAQTVLQRFEAQVVRSGDSIALVFADQQLSYQQLNEQANQLAYAIRQSHQQHKGKVLAADTPIVLVLARGINTIVGILAVLKAGGAYVPVSVDYPVTRTRFIIEDTQTPLVICEQAKQTALEQLMVGLNNPPSLLLADNRQIYRQNPRSNLAPVSGGDDLAYIIYTSGTTGQPKGVMISHGVFGHFIAQATLDLNLGENPVCVLSSIQYTFDVFGLEYASALVTGGQLVLSQAQTLHRDLAKHIAVINYIVQTPAVWQLFVADPSFAAYAANPERLKHIQVLIGGDSSPHELLETLAATFKRVNHGYGPTETCVMSTNTDYLPSQAPGTQNIIGGPLAGEQVWVLSRELQLLPIGAVGELYIGGAGLARGYFNRDDLTAKTFIDSPLPEVTGKLYKTGDLVRWVKGKNRPVLEYLGRNDLQVKIRGFRIELNDIQSVLSGMPGIKQAVVIDRQPQHNSGKYLAAYYVLAPDQVMDRIAISRYLAEHLPAYMLPLSYSEIPHVPLNINGKLDRRALPEPELVDINACVAPQNSQQQSWCELWQRVLGLEQVGIEDNFFYIGGNSISAVQLVTAMNQQSESNITMAQLFEHRTIAGLDAVVKGQVNVKGNKKVHIQAVGRSTYPLSFAQQRLLFIEQFECGSDAYHIPYLATIDPDVELEVLQKSLNLVINAHPILKTVYRHHPQQGDYQQVLNDDIVMHIEHLNPEQSLQNAFRVQVNRPFDLSQEPSIRLHLIKQAKQQQLLMVWHHIGVDGWSIQLFLQQWGEVYHSLKQGRQVDIAVADISYGDYALWQQQTLVGDEYKRLFDYWQHQLSGYETLVLPTDKSRPARPDYLGRDIDFTLDGDLSVQLRQLAKHQHTTLYTVLLSAFYVTLATVSGQTDIVVGTPSDNREHEQTQALLGLFVNSLVMRGQASPQLTIAALVQQVHQVVIEAKLHQQMPFEKLVEGLAVERDASRHPIYQVMFSMLSYSSDSEVQKANLPLTEVTAGSNEKLYSPAKFDLSVFFNTGGSLIEGNFNYALSVFEQTTVQGMVAIYQRVLQAFADDHTQMIGQIDLLSAQQRQMMLIDWNQTAVAYPPVTVHQLFEQQVEQTPDKVALLFESSSLSYAQLNQKANQLARQILARQNLVRQNPGSQTLIALYFERSIEMVIAMLAVLKTGGAYVPISPQYPQTRVQFMLEDSGAELMLSQSQHFDTLQGWTSGVVGVLVNVLVVDSDQLVDPAQSSNLKTLGVETDVAYVNYTSGTTGQPKGVLTPHRGVVSLLWHNPLLNLSEQDVLLHLSDPCFDAATFEIWGALLHGAKLVIADAKPSLDAAVFKQYLNTHQVNVLWLTKSLFDHWYVAQPTMFNELRCLLLGGEALNPTLIRQLLAQPDRPAEILNGYGPTESTTFTTLWRCEAFYGSVPLGTPTNNRRVYVLNEMQQPVPPGCVGELTIAGAGLAQGYLNRDDLTAARFINNPFATAQDLVNGYRHLYKTGDLVRWTENEELQYLGRNDNQLKIRGFRIEPDEIQNALQLLPQVKQAVVMAAEQAGNTVLVGYIVVQSGLDGHSDTLRAALLTQLPDHMVPCCFMFIEVMPLTANGKLDRRALPSPEFVVGESYVAPMDALEQQLCIIWQQVLGLEQVGVEDNFFRMGGNSINAIRLTAAIGEALNIDVPLALLFEQQNIRQLARHLGAVDLSKQDKMVIAHVEQPHYPLSFAQQRLWFIESFEQGTDAYHIPYLVKLNDADDADQEARLARLQAAFNVVINRHPVLKSVYLTDDNGEDYQRILTDEVMIHTTELAVDERLFDVVKTDIGVPFDLTSAPSIKLCRYLDFDSHKQEQYLLILIHHIAFDGWSVAIFMQELAEVYQALTLGREVNLAKPDISYGDYALWQSAHLTGDSFDGLLHYWQQQLSGFETLALATDYPRPARVDYQGADVNIQLDQGISVQLRQLAKSQQTTLYTVMLSGFYLTLAVLSGQDDIVLGTPSENRQQPQTQGLIGFFVNSLALRCQLDSSQSISALIQQVHQIVIQGKIHQALPFEKLVDALDIERDTSRHPIYQLMFGLQSFAVDSEISQLPFQSMDLNAEQAVFSPAKFDLSLFLDDGQNEISGCFNYALSLFKPATIQRLAALYQRVLRAAVDITRQTQPIAQLDWLSADERHCLLQQWHQTDCQRRKGYPQTTLHQLFEAQVAKTPDKVALLFAEQGLSYAQLNQQANQLAIMIRANYRRLHQRSMPPGTLVTLYLDRSVEMVVAILAVLKAGGAYVPISPEYPSQRVEFILKDTGAALMLSQQRHLDQLNGLAHPVTILAVDSLLADVSTATVDNLTPKSYTDDLAYVIYTSGTTGQPKGVAISHGASIGRNLHMAKRGKTAGNVYLFKTPYVFDVSVSDIFSHLLVGAQIVISESSFDVQEIEALISRHQINACHFVPAQFSLLNHVLDKPLALDNIYFSGENLTRDQLDWLDFTRTRVVNYYGPTETGEATSYIADAQGEGIIGRPLQGTRVYVLDQHGQLAPPGAVGELYIGGSGLASGYFNRPDLSKGSFVDKALCGEGEQRLYKTGDRVRWLTDTLAEDGLPVLAYLGRYDEQVKIRGFRVELGEIQSVLAQLPSVQQAVVVVDIANGNNPFLAAYVVAPMTDEQAIKNALSAQLPDYMIPTTFTWLDEIPLTINGKVDRRALPVPSLTDSDGYMAPRNALEQQLCDIFQQVLGLEQVGITDNFFAIGGNSLLVLKVIAQIKRQLNLSYPIKQFYSAPTIAQLVAGGANNRQLLLSQEAILDPAVTLNTRVVKADARQAILLTGATGFVGRYLLAELLVKADLKLYCLVRAKTVEQGFSRIKTALTDYGLWQADFAGRIEVVLGDLGQPELGIDSQQYQQLSIDVAKIYHCGTYMDHLATYDQMKGVNVDGINQLLKFVCCGRQKSLEYLSTTGIFNAQPGRVVAECSAIEHEQHDNQNGYLSTKWVAEKLIMLANERGFAINIHRLGLVTGDQRIGKNDPSQWFDKLIVSCLNMGCCFAEKELAMSLLPVNMVAQSIVALSERHHKHQRGQIYHLTHPESVAFVDLINMYNEYQEQHQKQHQITLVPFAQFIARLKQAVQQGLHIPIEYQFSDWLSLSDEALEAKLEAQLQAKQASQVSGLDAEPFVVEVAQTGVQLQREGLDFPAFDQQWLVKYFGWN